MALRGIYDEHKPATAKGGISASENVYKGKARVWALSITTTSAAGNIIIYDNTVGSGTTVWRIDVPATAGACNSVTFPNGIACNTGIYMAVTGANTVASVCYSPEP